jgi:hypothetical protein
LRLLIITSCTGEKSVTHKRALTLDDFRKGREHIARRERELHDFLTPAEDLYTGQQHVRLMRGVRAMREARHEGEPVVLSLWILSAGYGFVPGSQKLAPYEATFQGMKTKELRAWADKLQVPAKFQEIVSEPYDLGLVLLGDSYLAACALDSTVGLGGPTTLLCGANASARLPTIRQLRSIALGNAHARRFACGLVGLKGEIAGRVLKRIDAEVGTFERLRDPGGDVLALLDGESRPLARHSPRANPEVDQVIRIPEEWWNKPHRHKLRYFIPEWDDLVDADYDFQGDSHSGGSGDWSNEVYAHQLYAEPNYDGILVSRVVAEKSKKKRARINALGVHRFLRVPRAFPVMGDCGAFGYIHETVPPYSTTEVLDYYSRLDFDYGVSVDHLIVTSTLTQRKERYQLTVQNAEDFLREHRKRGLRWEPVGAVQGWDPASYSRAARAYEQMGYRLIGLGGLVRSSTNEVLRVLDAVRDEVGAGIAIHLFGLARLARLSDFVSLGVRSIDSASLLRRAWMGTGQNYLTASGEMFAAIRIPEAGKSFRAKRMVGENRATESEVRRLERLSLNAIRDFDAGRRSIDSTLDAISEYDRLITPGRPDTRSTLRRTLEARPWRACPCGICRRHGVEVIIFRGNNRNRRRGFHNTFVFYRLLQRALNGEAVRLGSGGATAGPMQVPLFGPEGAPTNARADAGQTRSTLLIDGTRR